MSHPSTTFWPDLRAVLGALSPRIRRMLVVATLLGFVAGFLEAVGIGAVAPLVIVMTELDLTAEFPRMAQFIPQALLANRPALILAACALFAGVFLVKAGLMVVVSYLQANMRGQLVAELASRLFADYLRRPYAFHLHRNAAESQTRLGQGVYAAANTLDAVAHALIEGIALAAVTVLLLYVNLTAALVAVTVIGIPGYAIVRALRRRLRASGQLVQEFYRQSAEASLHAFGGIKELKVLGREGAFHASYERALVELGRITANYGALQAAPRLVLELATVLALLGLAGVLAIQGKIIAIAPLLGLYAAAAFRLLPAANRIVVALQTLRYSEAGLHIVAQDLSELDHAAGAAMPGPSTTPLPLKAELRLEGVSFSFGEGQPPVLLNVDLAIRAGECVGFIGATGSGKSTLMDLVLGVLEPTRGRILVDGTDIRARPRDWQAGIGYVPQAIFLIDDTIRANVAFGMPRHEVDEERVWNVLRAAQLESFVRGLPKGLDTTVGERGIRLSGGERQRVGIARALYHHPGLLILDEATSALDSATEAAFMDAVFRLRGESTILIVAHRLTTIERCDRVFVLEEGRLSPRGSKTASPLPTLFVGRGTG